MNYKYIILITGLFCLFSCGETIRGLTIVHFRIENKNTAEPLEDYFVDIVCSRSGWGGDGNTEYGRTKLSDNNGEIEYTFLNKQNSCRAWVTLGLSNCVEYVDITLGEEQSIVFQVPKIEKLIAIEIPSIIDSVHFGSNRYCHDFLGSYDYIRTINDTTIYFKAIPNDTVNLRSDYFIEGNSYADYKLFELDDKLIYYELPL